MAATTGTAASGDPDMALIGELMEEMSRHPPAIGARKLLVEHYISIGWLEAAMDNAKELKSLAPRDVEVKKFMQILEKQPEPPAPEKKKTVVGTAEQLEWDPKTAQYKNKTAPKPKKKKHEAPMVELNGNLNTARQDLTTGYQTLRAKATYILADLLNLKVLQKKAGIPQSDRTNKIQAIAEGKGGRSAAKAVLLGSARSVARTIRERPKEAINLAITDLEDTMKWIRASHGKPSGASTDTVRDALVKRKDALESALPDNLKSYCETAFMHVEHEHLERNYANTETMLGDEVKDIPRANFYVTEDNYAWDMEELVQAITVAKGVMRNPLSREMFTPKDVKGICMHPLGKGLAALAVEQHELSKGVRLRTIEEMEKLSKILLEDQTSDTLPSRRAVDEFLAYVATRTFSVPLSHLVWNPS